MTITLPDEMRAEVERKAAAAGFATVAEYIVALVTSDDLEVYADLLGPEEGRVKARADLEAKLLASLDSGPPVLADEAFWAERQRKLDEAVARRNGVKP